VTVLGDCCIRVYQGHKNGKGWLVFAQHLTSEYNIFMYSRNYKAEKSYDTREYSGT